MTPTISIPSDEDMNWYADELIALMDAYWMTEQGTTSAPILTAAIMGLERIRQRGFVKPVRRRSKKADYQWFRMTSSGYKAALAAITAYDNFIRCRR